MNFVYICICLCILIWFIRFTNQKPSFIVRLQYRAGGVHAKSGGKETGLQVLLVQRGEVRRGCGVRGGHGHWQLRLYDGRVNAERAKHAGNNTGQRKRETRGKRGEKRGKEREGESRTYGVCCVLCAVWRVLYDECCLIYAVNYCWHKTSRSSSFPPFFLLFPPPFFLLFPLMQFEWSDDMDNQDGVGGGIRCQTTFSTVELIRTYVNRLLIVF